MKDGNMWDLSTPRWEIVLRALIVYIFVFTFFRLVGRKQLGETSPFDLVLLIIISESVGKGFYSGDQSLSAAVISCPTLIIVGYLVDWLAFKSKKIQKILDGEAQKLISNGRVH
ncbi:MAG: DUF421 domain-containing protein [Bdellovibrionaceae bacterium]|nr:DUF421 domain-containing protein [Bdellovibrio sp.]